MDNRMYAIREFHDVIFTAGHDLHMGDTVIPEGDIIMSFSKIPRVQIQERRDRIDAEGGQGNRSRVSWDETRGLLINFSQGVVSMKHMAFLANAKTNKIEEYLVPEIEAVYADEYGIINLKYQPVEKITLYSESKGKEVIEVEDKTVEGLKPNEYYNAHYHRREESVTSLDIGSRWITGYMRMTAKAKMKDEQTGKIRTLVIDLPKVQLLSDLNMVLGSSNDVMSAYFSIVAHPVGHRNNQSVGKFLFLGSE